MTRYLTFITLVALLLNGLVACAPSPNIERGTLEGHITFAGSAANANQPTPIPLFYEQHSLIIYRSDGTTLVANVLLDARGDYRVNLDPGAYVVKWRKYKDETTKDLPATVTIVSGKATRLDVKIDTGTR